MTAYHGSKKKIGAEIASIIGDHLDVLEGGPSGYLEPFVGMAGVYRHIPKLLGKYNESGERLQYLAGDVNKPIIEMWRACQRGWKPPVSFSERDYYRLKDDLNIGPLHGYIGHACSFRNRYMGTYSPDNASRLDKTSSNVLEVASRLKDVQFYNCDYKSFSDLEDFIIYCDPPYEDTECRYTDGYEKVKFDHEEFWSWCDKMSDNNIVLVSERSCPYKNYDVYKIDENENLYVKF